MTVRIVVWPLELGRSVMKSMAICDQGRCGMGRGWNPAGNKGKVFGYYIRGIAESDYSYFFLEMATRTGSRSWIVALKPG